MRKTILICDRCGKEIPEGMNPGYIYLGSRNRESQEVLQDPCEFENNDYCESCLIDITKHIACGAADKKDNKPAVEPAKPTKAESTPTRRKIDYGKIEALANAGWSSKDIAEEMGMTTKQVVDARYRINNGIVKVKHEYLEKKNEYEEWL